MIYNLCNIGNEQNATFSKVSIMLKDSLGHYNHLSSDNDIQAIITNLPTSADVINFDLLPENLSITVSTTTNENGKRFNVTARMLLTPLDKNLYQLLEQYNNKEVVLLLQHAERSFLYGTSTSPLILTYNELHSNQAQGLKGYTLLIRGTTLAKGKQFENIDFSITNRGLAFDLAGTI